MTARKSTYRLKFTGNCSWTEFQERCKENPWWYHSFYFDNGFVQHGDYDIGRDIAGYEFPSDMKGLSVLDVGTGSGWFATYFEQTGAEVVTVDVRGYGDLDVFGRPGYPDITSEKPAPDHVLPDGRPVYFSPVSKGFWVMKDVLGLKAEYVNARVYDLRPELFGGRKFDLVFVGAVLMHLRDPIGALAAVRSVCRHQLVANSFLEPDEGETPRMTLRGGFASAEDPYVPYLWWVPNRNCLVQWFKGAGFSRVSADKAVRATVDRPFVNEHGQAAAAEATLTLVNAYV
jgi:SAM-dependent methyltransferase